MPNLKNVSLVRIKKMYLYLLQLGEDVIVMSCEGSVRYFIMMLYEFIATISGFKVKSNSEDEVIENLKTGLTEVKTVLGENIEVLKLVYNLMTIANNIRHNPCECDYIERFKGYILDNIDEFIVLYRRGLLGFDDRLINLLKSNSLKQSLSEMSENSISEFRKSVIIKSLKDGISVDRIVSFGRSNGWLQSDINKCIVDYLCKNKIAVN